MELTATVLSWVVLALMLTPIAMALAWMQDEFFPPDERKK